ncbi:CCHCR protein, partial [Amia calva]|nr:CCHCR protein [Amia calva]
MDKRQNTTEKLNPPADFAVAASSTGPQSNLVPPSHFAQLFHTTSASSLGGIQQPPACGVGAPLPLPTSAPTLQLPPEPWAAIAQARQEISELRRENQRILENAWRKAEGPSQEDNSRTRSSEREAVGGEGRLVDSEWRLESRRLGAEAERLRGQVEILKETSRRQTEELRERDGALCRQRCELEEVRAELIQARREQQAAGERLTRERDQARAELSQSQLEQERQLLQLEERWKAERERLTREAEKARGQLETLAQGRGDRERREGQEGERLRAELESARAEAEWLRGEVERGRRETEAAHSLETATLKEQIMEAQRRHQAELQALSEAHAAELKTLRQSSAALEAGLGTAREEVTQLRRHLQEASQTRDELLAQLREARESEESQAATVQSLRKYIGELTPESEEQQERLTDTVQKLEREKESLKVTVELLTVRLRSLTDILTIQEAEMGDKSGPVSEWPSDGGAVLRRWREKVFMLLVQLRSQDLELRGQEGRFRNQICSLEGGLKRQGQQLSVLQHSLEDRTAELEMERVGSAAVQQELSRARGESLRLEARREEAESAVRQLAEVVVRCRAEFKERETALVLVESRLLNLGQRISFACKRLDTVQGLILRKEALQKLQREEAHRQTQPEPGRLTHEELQAELKLVSEERDLLNAELRRTPQLIEGALREARQHFECELRQLSEELGCREQAERRAEDERERAEQAQREAELRLEGLQGALQQARDTASALQSELSEQHEQSQRALQEQLSELESGYRQQLRAMEAQLNTARREHTKAVVALRQSSRQTAREREREQELQRLQEEHRRKEMEELQRNLREAERDKNLLMTTIRQEGLLSQYKKTRSAALQTSSALAEQPQPARPAGKSQAVGPSAKPSSKESLCSVLEDLQALSVAVIDSGETSSEEEEDRGL